ncbi:MAG TPA: Ldh family oxidoreductase, partial [bacterium]|nr:Ldh family oxidoreductase [bacterium]
MALLFAPQVREFTKACFVTVGFPPAEAELIARLMVEANLTGHETHGIRQIPRYIAHSQNGEIRPGAPVTVVQETAATAVLDGHRTSGFVAATRGVELAMAKAKATQVAA